MVVRLTGPRRHWVVLESFIPCLYSGTLISLLFGLNDFAKKTNFRFSKDFLPESPFIPDDGLIHQKTPKLLYDVIPITCAHRICNSLPSSTPMDNHIHLPFLHSSPVALVITRYPKYLSLFRESFCAYCLAVPCRLNTPTN